MSTTSYTALGPPDAPAIVLVHGTRLSRGMWHPQLAALSGGFRVVALDLPGHGSLRDRPFAWDEAVDEIARVIDEAAGGRAVLCGLSLGGYLAIDVAARYPDKVAGLAISGASAEPRGRVFPPAINWLAAIMERSPSERLDRVNRSWFRRRYPPANANAVLAGGFGFEAGATALRALVGRDARATFASYPGPTLILNGQLDLPFRLGQHRFRRAGRDVRVVVLRRATHLANLDRPSAFSAALARFAAEVYGAERRVTQLPTHEPAEDRRAG